MYLCRQWRPHLSSNGLPDTLLELSQLAKPTSYADQPISDCDPETIALIPQTKFAIFILSTFGEGDSSNNTGSFWEQILKSQDISLSNLHYVAFGLSNSNYKYYNRVTDVVDEALEKFGARLLMLVGKADDADGATEEDFMAWKDDLFSIFRKDLRLEEREVAHEPTLSAVEDGSLEPVDLYHGKLVHTRDNAKVIAPCSSIKALTIQNSRELFSSSSRNCIHMELDLNDQLELHHKTGDHLAVWPTNPDIEVERLLRILGLGEIFPSPSNRPILPLRSRYPTPDTLFRYHLEICGPISRGSILSLAQFAPNPSVKTYLTALSRDNRLLEISIGGDPSTTWYKLPLSYLIKILLRTQPRYSISSSSVLSPRPSSITALDSTSPLPNAPTYLIHSLTTSYLLVLSQSLIASGPQPHPHGLTYHLTGPSNAPEGGKLFAHIRKSKFKLPTLASCPLIMVAASTGLAPFRAFITKHFIYHAEIEEMERALDGRLRIVTAFSRINRAKKVYVQDRVQEMDAEALRLLSEGAKFYICGHASMAREVRKRQEVKEWGEGVKRRAKWQEDISG
ncbi:riboflavin synthase domain-like protein [Cenococcum geophilum 1.58]|uniref:riboflavin synthase domain-like protein n=1 Tax=Cenococcum geophilum 1.58 TaxID=794803 RepID=UPI00358EE1B2|nr:riboflavin synthase domain-like protein [Cenococcum geophilum 1.58]